MTWCVRKREKGAKNFSPISIGHFREGYPDHMSVAAARDKAKAIISELNAGRHPNEEKKRQAEQAARDQGLTFASVADTFLADCESRELRGATMKLYRFVLKGSPCVDLHKRLLKSIERGDIEHLKTEMESHAAKAGRGKYMAAQVCVVLRVFFNYCVDKEYRADNPAERVKPAAKKPKRDRSLSIEEVRRLYRAGIEMSGIEGALVCILILTGQRRNETVHMRWQDLELDGDASYWSLPASITKNKRPHVVPLPQQAVAILRALPRIDNGPYVFSCNGSRPLSSFTAIKRALDRKVDAPTIPNWVFHDARRAPVTLANELPLADPLTIEIAINHAGGIREGVAGIYNKAAKMPERRRLFERYAELVSGHGPSNNVLPLRAA